MPWRSGLPKVGRACLHWEMTTGVCTDGGNGCGTSRCHDFTHRRPPSSTSQWRLFRLPSAIFKQPNCLKQWPRSDHRHCTLPPLAPVLLVFSTTIGTSSAGFLYHRWHLFRWCSLPPWAPAPLVFSTTVGTSSAGVLYHRGHQFRWCRSSVSSKPEPI